QAPRSEVLINQLVYALPGALDVSALEQAWQAVVDRHAMLRVGFAWENLKQPIQFVREDVTLTLEQLDWQAEPRATLEDKLAQWLPVDRARALTLAKPPLMRLTLIRVAADEYWLVWTSHHLILDRWCIGLILQEVSALYKERCGGQPAALPPARSYRDFVAWLQKHDRNATETFWREQLRGLRHPTPLPMLPGGGAVSDFAEWQMTIPARTVEALRGIAQRNRLTMGTLAVGAWALLLGALSRQPEVLAGVTVSGRPAELPGVESIIGSFINTLPLRLALPPDEALLTWLASVQQRQLALRDYEHVSLPQLQEWCEFEHNVALFETLFLFQAAVKPASASRLQWRSLRGTFRTGLPLALAVAEEADGLTLWAAYAQSHCTDEMVRAWLERFATLLQAIAADPLRPLSAFLAGVAPITVAQSSPVSHTVSFSRNGHTPVAPRNAIETHLARLWGPILDQPTVDVTANFFESGGTSLKALQFMDRVERTFKSKLPLASLLQAPTIEKLAVLIDSGGATEKWSSLIPIQPLGARRPLFVVHHGGGGIFEFANVARYLGHDQPVYGLQEPGFEVGEARLDSVEALAAHYLHELRSVQPEGPYALSGFCFGGVVAYEMAQQLRREGQRTAVLILIDAESPGSTSPAISDRVQWHAHRLADLAL
ncbi:MAG: condensation domain-containing protein, partial [Anaerolineales bacterium]